MCSAVNEIDMSALESLEAVNERLRSMGVKLHLSEVKGPVTDRLKRSHFLDDLTEQVFLSQYDAWMALTGARPDPGFRRRSRGAGSGCTRPARAPRCADRREDDMPQPDHISIYDLARDRHARR
jgi:hypothetical protein